jgi:hypothetical protein
MMNEFKEIEELLGLSVGDLLARCEPLRDLTPECVAAIQGGSCERIEFQRDRLLSLVADSLNDLVNDYYRPETIQDAMKPD